MLTSEEQERIRPLLESLSHRELLRLWRRFGIASSESPLENLVTVDKAWLIGPLMADTEYEQLNAAIADEQNER